MNLINIVNLIKQISIEYPTIKEFGEGDIYGYLNSGEHKYPCIFLTIESISSGENSSTVNATLFFVDRLLNDNSNKLSVQTVGLEAIKSIIERCTNEISYINFESINYTPFTEKFSDMCAGVFASFSLEVNEELECSDDFARATLTIYDNGIYNTLGYSQVLVVVPKEIGVKSIGGKKGTITLGKGLTINDSNVLSGVDPHFIEGENINITHTGDDYRFDVPDMRYDDSDIKETIESLIDKNNKLEAKLDYVYQEIEQMFYTILTNRFNGKPIVTSE